MPTYTWRNSNGGAGGAFDNASNWSNPSETVSTTVPSANDVALFSSGGGTISGSGAVDTIAFSAAAWTIAGQLSTTNLTLGNGSLTGIGSTEQLVVNGGLQVGLLGNAALSLINGGSINVTSGTAATSSFGAATLSVVNRSLASFGNLTLGVNNAAATAVVDGSVLAVGGVLQMGATGSGTLNVLNGSQAVLSAAVDTTAPYLQVGAVAGSAGTVAVDGANSLLLLANNSGAVGYRGNGTLTVTGGGSARFNASANANNNALNPALTIGLSGTGSVTVSGAGSSLAAGGSVIVGGRG